MPKSHVIWEGFRTGELSPDLDGQVSFDKYYQGCRLLQNFIPTPQGKAFNRPGFRYIAPAKYHNRKCRLVPFEFSTEQAYVLEFGHQYIRFYMNYGQIQTLDSYTTLYLRMNGIDASTTFLDESPYSPHTVTANGNAQIDTEFYKFGGASGMFDGAGDYLSIPDNPDFDFSGGVWTVDTWVRVRDFVMSWTQRTSGTTNDLYGITYGNSLFVVVGGNGTILTSPDGITWTQRTSGTTNDLYGITYGNSLFVAVGSNGTILTSPDGITWTQRTSGVTITLWGVTYGNSLFVVVGNGGTILTSPDGITWTQRTSGTTNHLHGITYGNSLFVVVGGNGTILTSPDGITWTQRTSGVTTLLRNITYGNSLFVVVGDGGTILTSPDGIAWTQRTSGTTVYLHGITYGNSLFVAVGNGGTILTSPDGITWTQRTSGVNVFLLSVVYNNSLFVVVGFSGTILNSNDNKHCIYSQGNDANTNFELGITSNGRAYFNIKSAGTDIVTLQSVGATVPLLQWIHLAVVEDGNNYYLFVQGVQKATAVDTDRPANYTGSVFIGKGYASGVNDYNGWMDEFRVSKGIARWTANFTPPTVEYIGDPNLATPYEITTPYTESELPQLQFTQSADILFIVHPNHPPAKLSRFGHTNWAFDNISFIRQYYPSPSLLSSSFDSFNATNCVDSNTNTKAWDNNMTGVGAYLQLNAGANNARNITKIAIYIKDAELNTTYDIEYSSNGTTWYKARTGWNLRGKGLGWVKIEWASVGSYQYWRLLKTDAAQAGGNVTEIEFYEVGNPSVWAVGKYPSSVTFFEDRLWLAYLQTIWASKTGDYYNLTLGTDADDGLEYTISSNQVNKIHFLSSGKVLAVGTASDIYKLSASQTDEAITPLNVRIVREVSHKGAAYADVINIDSAALYLSRSLKKVREFAFNFEDDSYTAPDMTLLAGHLTVNNQISYMTYQPEPLSCLWCFRDDGVLLGFTYQRAERILAWHRHTTDGAFESGTNTYSLTAGYELWAVVKRIINGVTKRYIEVMEQPFNEDTLNTDKCFFVDSGLIYNGAPTSTIGGLEHLEGKTVSVLADGAVQTPRVVSNGTITLSTPAGRVIVGLPYESILQTMRIEKPDMIGTAQGRKKRINQAVVRLYKTKQFKYGSTPSGALQEKVFDSLYSGDYEVDNVLGWDREGYFTIKNDAPLPCSVVSIVTEVDVQ